MAKIRKILVGVDFSENSKKTLKYAHDFFSDCGIEIHVVHVVNDAIPEGSYIPHTSIDEMGKDAVKYATEELEKFVPRKVMAGGADVRLVVLKGEPYSTVIEYAEKSGLELIVVGSHGASKLEKMLLGSVTDKIIRKSPIPILVVKN
jgi:universal stress protein A